MTDKEMRAACAIGWPIKQSKSPIIHGYWIERYGINGEYRLEAVPPEDFPAFITNLPAHGYVGCNVTIPHKLVALANSEPDDRARAVGAANALWIDGDRLRSTNTDVEGFVGSLDASAPGWDENLESAVVCGAGGAGRAVVFGLLERGVACVHLVNRTPSRAQALREAFGPRVHPATWEDLPRVLDGAGLIANATSLGMTGNPDVEWDLAPMRDDAVAADVVYAPLKTSLLAVAERRGFGTSDGLGMLLHQAIRGFELWFGVRPEVTTELRALVERALAKS